MEIIGIAINKVIVELIFIFIMSTPGTYPMHIDMIDAYGDLYNIEVTVDNDNYDITISSDAIDYEIYAEWYDVFAYMIYLSDDEPYLIDLAYFFEIELTDYGFPEQTFNHDMGGEIYLYTDREETVVKYMTEDITFIMDTQSFWSE